MRGVRSPFPALLAGLTVLAAGASGAAAPPSKDGPTDAVLPLYDQCTLEMGKETVKPLAVVKPEGDERRVGARRIRVVDDGVADLDAGTGKERWKAKTADGSRLRWLSAADGVAYLLGFRPAPGDGKAPRFDRPAAVRRLSLSNGEWLPALAVGPDLPDGRAEVVEDLLADRKGCVVLSLVVDTSEDRGDGKVVSYRVTCFEGGKDKPHWSRAFDARGDRPAPGAFLLGARGPDYATSSLRGLTRLGGNVVVCAGEREDLLCLDAAGGKVVWRTPRLWEYARGFTGPSVWSHHIGRFGEDSFEQALAEGDENVRVAGENEAGPKTMEARKEAKQRQDALRKEFDRRFICVLVAGPILAPGRPSGGEGKDAASLFVAVAKGPAAPWSGYLSECWVYELREDGRPVAVAPLPRMVSGAGRAVGGGVVWPCQRGAFVRLRPSPGGDAVGGALDADDGVCDVEWYRQPRPPTPSAWLTAGPAADALAFTATKAVRAVAGGYVVKPDDGVYRFPLTVVDLQTGLESTATLAAPFRGKVHAPETNFSGGDGRYRTFGPHELELTGLEAEGDVLRVWLATETDSAGVEFDLASLLKDRDSRGR